MGGVGGVPLAGAWWAGLGMTPTKLAGSEQGQRDGVILRGPGPRLVNEASERAGLAPAKAAWPLSSGQPPLTHPTPSDRGKYTDKELRPWGLLPLSLSTFYGPVL